MVRIDRQPEAGCIVIYLRRQGVCKAATVRHTYRPAIMFHSILESFQQTMAAAMATAMLRCNSSVKYTHTAARVAGSQYLNRR